MPDSRERKGDRIDVAGVPVGGRGNLGIGAPAVLIDPGDHPVIAILETDIGGVDIGARGQRAIEQVVALLGTEVSGFGGGHFGEKAQRAFRVLDQVLGTLNAGPAGLRDRLVEDRHHCGGVLVVIVDQDEDENGNAQADEQQRHDQAQSQPPPRDKPRKRAQSGQGAAKGAAASVRDQRRDRQSGRHEQQCDQPAPQAAVVSVPDQRGRQRIVAQQSKLPIGRGDASPAGRILFANPIRSRPTNASVCSASNSKASRLFFCE